MADNSVANTLTCFVQLDARDITPPLFDGKGNSAGYKVSQREGVEGPFSRLRGQERKQVGRATAPVRKSARMLIKPHQEPGANDGARRLTSRLFVWRALTLSGSCSSRNFWDSYRIRLQVEGTKCSPRRQQLF